MIGRWMRRLFFFAVALFLVAPVVVVAGVSLNAPKILSFPPAGFSLDWYGQIFGDDGWRNALFSSLIIARLGRRPFDRDRLPAGLGPVAAEVEMGGDSSGARDRALHPAAGHHRTWLPVLLGDARGLWRAVDRRHQPRRLLRDLAARHPHPRLRLDRARDRRGGDDHGREYANCASHRRPAACPPLPRSPATPSFSCCR